jgi:D-amino-acid dehydrogenase
LRATTTVAGTRNRGLPALPPLFLATTAGSGVIDSGITARAGGRRDDAHFRVVSSARLKSAPPLTREPMHVVVIGAGIVGVTTAYYLRQRGFEVTVLERNTGVAQAASFANAGVIAPSYVAPWAQPGMPSRVLSGLFRADSPVLLRPRLDAGQWGWLVRSLFECRRKRFLRNKERMQRLARYSLALLQRLRDRYELDYEQTQGYLQLYRSEADLERGAVARAALAQTGAPHRLLTAGECRKLEPALNEDTPLAGGLFFPEDETGNCAYFARRLKDICVADGVRFRYGTAAQGFVTIADRVEALLSGAEQIRADAYVVAAGCDSALLLRAARVKLPLYPVKGYSATVTITRPEYSPKLSVMDDAYKVAITRMGNRLRIAGMAEIGSRTLSLRDSALRTLINVARAWFPGAGAYPQAQYWVGARPMLPDGPPVLGETSLANLYVNVGHGSSGWAMACGSARIVADVMGGDAPEIDLDGLTIWRYRRRRKT